LDPCYLDLSPTDIADLDSANACDRGLLNENAYVDQFSSENAQISAGGTSGPVWLQTHRPLWGVERSGDGAECNPTGDEAGHSDKHDCINATLEAANSNTPLFDESNERLSELAREQDSKLPRRLSKRCCPDSGP
jgi:hypothetical protein